MLRLGHVYGILGDNLESSRFMYQWEAWYQAPIPATVLHAGPTACHKHIWHMQLRRPQCIPYSRSHVGFLDLEHVWISGIGTMEPPWYRTIACVPIAPLPISSSRQNNIGNSLSICLEWDHMDPCSLTLRLEQAICLRIISETLLTPKRTIETQNLYNIK